MFKVKYNHQNSHQNFYKKAPKHAQTRTSYQIRNRFCKTANTAIFPLRSNRKTKQKSRPLRSRLFLKM